MCLGPKVLPGRQDLLLFRPLHHRRKRHVAQCAEERMTVQLRAAEPGRGDAAEEAGQASADRGAGRVLPPQGDGLRPDGRIDLRRGPRRQAAGLAAGQTPRAMAARLGPRVAEMGAQGGDLAAVVLDPLRPLAAGARSRASRAAAAGRRAFAASARGSSGRRLTRKRCRTPATFSSSSPCSAR